MAKQTARKNNVLTFKNYFALTGLKYVFIHNTGLCPVLLIDALSGQNEIKKML
jgi:hypothetical protein